MSAFAGGIAVITGAASGFGLEASRIAAREGMRVVMADVQDDALQRAAQEVHALGAEVLPYRLDVSRSEEVEALAAATLARFGTPNFVFNNAGVGAGGLIWEHTLKDWEWVVGVNLMGVAHGVRVFTPLMLAAAAADPAWRGHIVNTASMAGLLNAPTWASTTSPSMRWCRSARPCTRTSASSRRRCTRTCCAPTSCPPASPAATATARRTSATRVRAPRAAS
jgi:NAD(P)-dependent dehydrogenase (short-subunit alcohol dehydrogenase family)